VNILESEVFYCLSAAYKVLGTGAPEKTSVFQLGPIALYYGFLAVLILYYSGPGHY
jgi:hypothetical protein